MNEPRFIELLNLYVDQQLSPQEAAELEAEIQKNPVRHRTYQQYCRMQKACAQLFEHERSVAPASAALTRAMADADRKVVAFPDQSTRRSMWPIGFSVGAVAAAACVAFVVVRQTNTGGPAQSGEVVATVESAPSVQAPVAAIAVAATQEQKPAVALVSASEEFRPVFTVQPLRSTSVKQGGLFVSVSAGDAQLLDWTREVQLKPLRKVSSEELVFSQSTAVDKPVTTQLSTTTAEEPMAAFQFTK
jgi:anti-sigma factor RsiW